MKIGAIIDLRKKIDSLKSIDEKIDFLEYESKNISQKGDYSASINYLLGENYSSVGIFVQDYYKKAASGWEFAAMSMGEETSEQKELRRHFLLQAIKSYKKAKNICVKRESFSESGEISNRIDELNSMLRVEGGVTRTVVLTLVSLIFGVSLILLSSPPTGLVISPLETDGTTTAGFVLVLVALIGAFLSIRWWLLSR